MPSCERLCSSPKPLKVGWFFGRVWADAPGGDEDLLGKGTVLRLLVLGISSKASAANELDVQ